MKPALALAILLAARAADVPPAASQMLAAHNAVRASVGVKPLVWSDRLAAYAQEWANTLLKNGKFEHRQKSPYGENLFEATGESASPEQVVKDWAAESRNYDSRTNTCRGTCGHYTQIVWRATKEVGCGMASAGGRQVWVCNYNPPGNYVGQRPY